MSARGILANAVAALGLCALALIWRAPLTALMSTHMLVQIPLLVLTGVCAEQAWRAWRDRAPRGVSDGPRPAWSYNEYGMPGLLLVSLVGACWMVPKALDDALVDWRVAAFKVLGLPLAGWILRASLRRSNTVVKLFFLGNFCWMSAIVGLIYQDQPVRLCNAYLQDDQAWTGMGLIALSIILPTAWLLARIGPIWRYLNR
ncbi:hypothetical protein [Castellaniella sp. GW247-6E4]|uniref:hypothetical protein n=1 Tax=Castellaniella sp. GW247-6E4 TaxID=3140380 RepID=UPI003315C9E1